jgi:hypothetical protein
MPADSRWYRIYEVIVLTYSVMLVIAIGTIALVGIVAMLWDLAT